MKKTLLVLSILVMVASAFAVGPPWTISGAFLPTGPGFDCSRVIMTAIGSPSDGIVAINTTAGTYEITVPNEWNGTVRIAITQIPGYTCNATPNNVGYDSVTANAPDVNWAITCTQDFVYTLNITSDPTAGSVFWDGVDTGIVTNRTITDANVANVIGSYEMMTPPTYGYDWDPAILEVYATDFTPENDWTHTIHFKLLYTLPVELSSFTVALNVHNNAEISWVSQTETEMSGYYIYRNTEMDLSDALLICDLIPATNSSQEHTYLHTDRELNEMGTYYYWLEATNLDGTESFFGPITLEYTADDQQQTPELTPTTRIKNIYPNPFNPNTNISYTLVNPADVNFAIFNSRGQLVKQVNLGVKDAGDYTLAWDGNDDTGKPATTGVYFFRMLAGDKSFSRKAILMK